MTVVQTSVRSDYNAEAGPSSWESSGQPPSTHLYERSAPMEHDSPTAVYRYYDRHGVLIYVGITKQGMGRNLQHNARAEWWPHVATQEVDHFPDRRSALERERDLIRECRPPFNRQHHPGHAEARAVYEAFLAGPSKAQPPEIFGAVKKRMPLRLVGALDTGIATWATDPLAFNLAKIVKLHEPTRISTPSGQNLGRVTKAEMVGMSIHWTGQVSRSILEGFEVERAYARLRCYPGKPMTFVLRTIMVPREADI